MGWLYPHHYKSAVLVQEEDAMRRRLIDVNRLCLQIGPREQFSSLLHLVLPPSVRIPEINAQKRFI